MRRELGKNKQADRAIAVRDGSQAKGLARFKEIIRTEEPLKNNDKDEQNKKLESLDSVFEMLKAKGWSENEILDAFEGCRRNAIGYEDLISVAEKGIDPRFVRQLVRIASEMSEMEGASLELCCGMFLKADEDMEKLEDFVKFCEGNEEVLNKLINKAEKEKNRERAEERIEGEEARDREDSAETAWKEMFDLFDVKYSSANEPKDLAYLDELEVGNGRPEEEWSRRDTERIDEEETSDELGTDATNIEGGDTPRWASAFEIAMKRETDVLAPALEKMDEKEIDKLVKDMVEYVLKERQKKQS